MFVIKDGKKIEMEVIGIIYSEDKKYYILSDEDIFLIVDEEIKIVKDNETIRNILLNIMNSI